jgi:signal transduction histidine kinase
VRVFCDFEIIRRVIENLVGNAIKFTPATGEVRISISTENGTTRVSVADNGPGIPAEYHEKIFQKFGQAQSQNKNFGIGLGLTFCKLAVEAHGGCLGVQSEIGQGSTFWFTLPLQ